MPSFKRVLVPVDFSQYSKAALPYALELAGAQGGKVVLAHFMHTSRLPEPSQVALAALRTELPDTDVMVEVGEPAPGIVGLARKLSVDLVVMATHGRTGLVRRLMGSTAEAVMRYAPCPVMVVRHPFHDRILPLREAEAVEEAMSAEVPVVSLGQVAPTQEDVYFARLDQEKIRAAARERMRREAEEQPHYKLRVRRVMVPTDLSTSSLAALPYAGETAAALGAGVQLLYVIDQMVYTRFMGEAALIDLCRNNVDDMRRRLLGARDWLRAEYKIEASASVAFGLPRHAIIAVAAEEHSDLIVISTHGRTGLQRAVMGSTAEAVVRRAPCPVVSLRCPTATEALAPFALDAVSRG